MLFYTTRVSLTGAAMCMNLINEYCFHVVTSYVSFSHCDILLCIHIGISYA